ncbi:AMP-binding protein [Paradesulfitobacterium aromaticivorans]
MHASRILTKNASFYPDSPAVVDGERRLTLKELDQRVHRLISVFRSRGMEKGDRIAVLAYNCQEYLECMHACERAGFVCVPLNWRLDPDSIAFILNHSESKVAIIQSSLLKVVLPIKEKLSNIQYVLAFGSNETQPLPEWVERYESSLEAVTPDNSPPEILDDDLAYIIYSSGTTGLPKGVMFNHRMQLEAAKTFISELGLKKSDISLNVMPLFHSGGHTMASAISYVAGTNIMMDKFEAEKVLQTISTEKVTVIHLVPTMLAALLEVPHIDEYDLSSLKTIFLCCITHITFPA